MPTVMLAVSTVTRAGFALFPTREKVLFGALLTRVCPG
jgi:hypothetical protein